MLTAHINIGSNLGDRHALIERAIELVSDVFGNVRRSDLIESSAWGYRSANKYLNIGVEFETGLSPIEVLHQLLEIEAHINTTPHRTANGGYADREIDIDLIIMADFTAKPPKIVTFTNEELTIPHPRMRERDFVLIPLRQLHPTLFATDDES